jgi:hypothetical protein
MRRTDEKKPLINDVNHFCVFKSPNSIPRTMMKNVEMINRINDKPYPMNKNHQGNINVFSFFLFSTNSSDGIDFGFKL